MTTNPDPMAEDELDQILLDIQKNTDVWWNTPRPEYKGKNPGIMLKEAKAAINAYTTNKIIEAEYRLALTTRQQLGSGIADYGDLPRPDLEKLVKAVVELLDDRIAELKGKL